MHLDGVPLASLHACPANLKSLEEARATDLLQHVWEPLAELSEALPKQLSHGAAVVEGSLALHDLQHCAPRSTRDGVVAWPFVPGKLH